MNSMPTLKNVYVEHVVFGIVHYVGRKGVEGEEVSHSLFLLVVYYFSFTQHKCIHYLITRQEEMFYLFFRKMEFYYELSN